MSVNKVILIGNLTRDPEARGTACAFGLATNETWTDKAGQKQERTEFHNIKAFGRLAEICMSYLKKGREVYVEGKLSYDSYEKDGVTKYTTEIVIQNMNFIGSVPASQVTDNEF